ncbi:hypothetical protein [Allomuricauda sp. d1]|uniref:arsenate reductase family protein n=1 Tax=Allomuricauda sp. d1 TaxID=3136725 RepID=UPI0031DB8791
MEKMGVIATDKREIKFYYSSASSIGKQALGYVQSSDKEVMNIDVCKTNMTGTQWAEIAAGLGKKVHQLIDVSHPDFINEYGEEVEIEDEHDWMKILEKTPSVLKYPIIVSEETYLQVKQPSDAKIFLDGDSAEIEKK